MTSAVWKGLSRHEAHSDDVPDPRRRDAGPGRPGGGPLGRVRARRLARPAYWPNVDAAGNPVAEKLNALPKHVASRTLREEDLTWAGSSLLGDDVPARVAELKARSGDELQVHGSAGLLQTLLRHELVDELRVLTFPVVLGTGKRLFGEGTVPAGVSLAESRTTSAGTVIAVYAFEGRPSYGSFALEDDGA
jgi:dihydrofolate reductase